MLLMIHWKYLDLCALYHLAKIVLKMIYSRLLRFFQDWMDLFKCHLQILRDIPFRIMRFHLAQVRDITDMVPFTVLIDVFIHHLLSGDGTDQFECFKDRDGIIPPPPILYTSPIRGFFRNASMKRTTSKEWMLSRTCFPLYPKILYFFPSRLHLIR
jgi:hypothetical protein